MKLVSYHIPTILLLYSFNAVAKDRVQPKRVEEKATFNIDRNRERDDYSFVQNLKEDEKVKALIQTKTNGSTGTSFLAQTMSLNVEMNIERAGIIGTTITKKEMRRLGRHPDVLLIKPDYTVQLLEDPLRHGRKLPEEKPYGIDMVLQDPDFWEGLGNPSGSIKVCVADTGYALGHPDLPSGDDVTGTSNTEPGYNDRWDEDGHGHGTHCSGTVAALGDNNKGVVGVIPNNAGGKFQLVIANA